MYFICMTYADSSVMLPHCIHTQTHTRICHIIDGREHSSGQGYKSYQGIENVSKIISGKDTFMRNGV